MSSEFFAAEGVGYNEFASRFQYVVDVLQGFLFVLQMGKHAKTDYNTKVFRRRARASRNV